MKLNYDLVHPEKVKLIESMLADPIVNELWLKFVNLGLPNPSNTALIKAREIAWNEYCYFRDQYLGLPPLVVPHIQGTNRRNLF